MTMILSGEIGFAGLREALQGAKSADSFTCENYPYERLRLALLDAQLTDADKLVRLRHALRYASIHSPESGVVRSLPIDRLFPNGSLEEFSAYGLVTRAGGWVEALPWRPEWLLCADTDGVDAIAMGEHDRPWQKARILSDPWIKKKFNLETYRGSSQALAVRSALHMPSGRMLLVLLPTGEGKSLIFQALAVSNPGSTVLVIVPTVALAQDHAASAKKITNLGDHEFAYLGGNDEANASIRKRILDGSQRLVFAAPETAVTSLRSSIIDAAKKGKLTALVIDEAHIVDAWGTDFRCEFQMLSALTTQVKLEAPEHAKPNIVCLSATMTPMSYETLFALFSTEALPGIAGVPRLRPESDIWIDREWVDIETRRERVIEAIRHLPRPAILYVTQPDDAEDWFCRLRDIGFGRIAQIHGRTSTIEKRRVVNQWRSGELDLVVGNSAFGLGIDFPNVRSVIHACLPESIDRYYQEIGRAGRDNRSCIALLIPSFQDKSIAKSQSNQVLISVTKGVARWNSMFEKKVRPDPAISRYIVDLETAPFYDQDMQNELNETWNAQVLNLMARSGLIQLMGLPSNVDHKHTIAIDVKDDAHANVETWNLRVEPLRQRILANNRCGYKRMLELVNNKNCPSKLFSETYKIDSVDTSVSVVEACGGCESCRKTAPGWFANWPNPPLPPWPFGRFDATRFNFLKSGFLFVERSVAPQSRKAQRHIGSLVDALWNAGWRKCIIVGEPDPMFLNKLANQTWCVAQSEKPRILAASGLPIGPELVWIESSEHLNASNVNQGINESERIYLIPNGCEDPRNPGSVLKERKEVRQVNEILKWIK